MSLELYRKERDAFERVFQAWKANSDLELEATFPRLDYTRFSNAIQHLRSLGLKEEPQEVKLNILLPNNLRFTLVGEAAVQAYCERNSLHGRPFHVVLKDRHVATSAAATSAAATSGPQKAETEVDFYEYGVRVKIRREIAIPLDDPRITQALQKWASIPKTFRYMTRFRFTSPTGVVFDASFVKSNAVDKRGSYIPATTFLGAAVLKQPIQYELEVEALRPSTTEAAESSSLLAGIVAVLRGVQKTHVLVRSSVRDSILGLLYNQTRTPRGKFPGPKSITLGREHMSVETEPGIPNIRTGDYNVTDKADGSRAFLVVAPSGHLYLADKTETVYGTDRRLSAGDAAAWAGCILDGEWVRHDKGGKPMNHFYAFDIFNGAKGADVSDRPFLTRSATGVTRLAALTEAIGVLSKAGYCVASIPPAHSFHIEMKTFQVPGDPEDPLSIFRVAATTLDRSASAPYHTDGLIFTPNESPMQKFGTWYAQLKWKPADQNSVDFLVLTEKTRDAKGLVTQADLITPKEYNGGLVHAKTLKLCVATNDDPALEDPRDTVLFKKPYVAGQRTGYRPTLFSPSPPDPMAAVCYVAIQSAPTTGAGAGGGAGAGAAGAAGAGDTETTALRLGNKDETIRCVNGDPIRSHTIVEMAYYPERAAGWRWEPMRVRWDKTEQFASGDVGAMNNDGVANGIWTSIHEPVTEQMIRTGALTEEKDSAASEGAAATVAIAASTQGAYYQKKPSQRDQHKARGLTDFHNKYIKNLLLLSKAMTPGCSLIDMSVGQGGDLHKWLQGRVGFVLGCDVALTGLTDRANGAYRRYLDQLGKQATAGPLVRGAAPKPAYMTKIPPMIFVQADSTKPYADGAAGITPLDRSILRSLWGENDEKAPPLARDLKGVVSQKRFDVASLMFTLHYFFKDASTLGGYLRNLADTVRVGGLFVGCCFDGDAVATLLKDVAKGGVKRGVEAGADVWTIKKQYEEPEGAEGLLPPTETGLGRAIDVNFVSIGATHTEYLVSFPYFQRRMETLGFSLLNEEELAEKGLVDSTNTFDVSYTMAEAAGYTYPMSAPLRTFSFLNRWFIFKRRSTGRGPAAATLEREGGGAVAAEASGTIDLVEPEPEPAGTIDLVEPEPEPAGTIDLVEPEPEAPVAAVAAGGAGGPPAAPAAAVLFPFYHKSAAKDDFKRKDKHWRRVLSTYAPFDFKDKDRADIVYPTLEAVLGAEKFKVATNRKELGPQLFGSLGTLHQNVAAKLAALGPKATIEDKTPLLEEQGDSQRDAQKPGAIKEAGAKWNPKLWTPAVVSDLLATYLRQRVERDDHFRRILTDVKAANGSLVYVGGGGDLGGKVVGDAVKGENLYGEALNAILRKL